MTALLNTLWVYTARTPKRSGDMDDDDNQDTPERPGVLRQGWKQNGRVTIACTACRTQHLRCDAAQPVCSRCRALNKPCVYTNVRRSRRKVAKVWDSSPSEPRARHEDVHDGIQTTDIRDVAIPTQQGPSNPPHRRTGASSAPFVPNCSVEASSAIDGFYSYFFPGHPFVLPRTSFISQVDRDPASVADLLPAMALVGSLYLRDGRSSSYRQGVEQALCQQLPPTGFSVQALMLFALVLEWSGENERAESTLGQAKSLALSIQRNQRPFATRHGQGIPVMEECWRRTWWELYVIDALFAGIRHQPTFDLWNVDTDVDLPGEEADYIEAVSISSPFLVTYIESDSKQNIASPRTLTEYEDRGFDQVDVPFSSFAYLVDAARILGTTLAAGDVAGGSPVALVKNAEANIMSWDLHLPQSKRDPVRPNGSVDEVLFRAHMVINTQVNTLCLISSGYLQLITDAVLRHTYTGRGHSSTTAQWSSCAPSTRLLYRQKSWRQKRNTMTGTHTRPFVQPLLSLTYSRYPRRRLRTAPSSCAWAPWRWRRTCRRASSCFAVTTTRMRGTVCVSFSASCARLKECGHKHANGPAR